MIPWKTEETETMKRLSVFAALLILVAGAIWWVGEMTPGEPVEIDNARVRLVPGGAPMAGYMVVRNHTDELIRLTAGASEAFGRVMIHRTVIEDGQARMRHQAGGIAVAPGEAVEFRPRGLHLMLMQPRADLAVGDTVEIVLTFDGLAPPERRVAFIVVPVTGA